MEVYRHFVLHNVAQSTVDTSLRTSIKDDAAFMMTGLVKKTLNFSLRELMAYSSMLQQHPVILKAPAVRQQSQRTAFCRFFKVKDLTALIRWTLRSYCSLS